MLSSPNGAMRHIDFENYPSEIVEDEIYAEFAYKIVVVALVVVARVKM
mgnify:CR=1 FL=1